LVTVTVAPGRTATGTENTNPVIVIASGDVEAVPGDAVPGVAGGVSPVIGEVINGVDGIEDAREDGGAVAGAASGAAAVPQAATPPWAWAATAAATACRAAWFLVGRPGSVSLGCRGFDTERHPDGRPTGDAAYQRSCTWGRIRSS
jgi:hypothetical protein